MSAFYFFYKIIFGTKIAHAHEAYVISNDAFWDGVKGPFSFDAFSALDNAHNLEISLIIAIAVIFGLFLNFRFRKSWMGNKVHKFFEQYAYLGPYFVRFTIGVSFIFSSLTNSFLGPELAQSAFGYQLLVKIILFAIGAMVIFGIFTEIAAFCGILVFFWSYFVFGTYVFTYLNYLGELIVLLLFGMRVFSIDRYIFGPLKRLKAFEKYETLIVRVFYGVALIYAAVTVKLLHPDLTISVVNNWNLTQFHWLFPSDPLLVTLGAGIVETIIGLFIIFGFEIRLTVLISSFYITLSLLYFRELVWPHLLLYGISLNLLVQPETFTIDHIIFKHHRKKKSWWKRPFLAHNIRGKSSLLVNFEEIS